MEESSTPITYRVDECETTNPEETSTNPTTNPEENMVIEQKTNRFSTRNMTCHSCNLQEYLTLKYFENVISRPCSFKYLLLSVSYSDVADEYNRFLDFIENQKEPGKTQLTVILFPIFVHFYFILLQRSSSVLAGSDNAAAHAFYEQHSKIFKNAEGYQDILKELYALKSIKDVQFHPEFKKYWKMKYIFKASLDVHQKFKSFLDYIDSEVLLFVLRFHFLFKCVVPNNEESEPKFHRSYTQALLRSGRNGMNRMNEIYDYPLKEYMNEIDLNDPYIFGLVIRCSIPDFSSIDLNNDGSQICVATGNFHMITANVQQQTEFPASQEQKFYERSIKGPIKSIFLSDPCFAVKYLPDNSNDILISSDTVKLMNTNSGKVLQTFQTRHSNSIIDLDVHLPAKLFATAGTDRLACVWSLSKETAVRTYTEHEESVDVVKFHPNGLYLATGSSDTTVRLWSIDRSYCIRSYVGHKDGVCCIAFSPDGKMFATGDIDGVIKIWNINDNRIIQELKAHKTHNSESINLLKITSLCFSHNSFFLASSNLQGNLKIWDVRISGFRTLMNFQAVVPLLVRCSKLGVWNVILK